MSLGASRTDIRLQFLFETIIVTGIGGIAGIILGVIVVYLASLIGLKAVIHPVVILSSAGIVVLCGVVAGFFPANRASNLDPVVALSNR